MKIPSDILLEWRVIRAIIEAWDGGTYTAADITKAIEGVSVASFSTEATRKAAKLTLKKISDGQHETLSYVMSVLPVEDGETLLRSTASGFELFEQGGMVKQLRDLALKRLIIIECSSMLEDAESMTEADEVLSRFGKLSQKLQVSFDRRHEKTAQASSDGYPPWRAVTDHDVKTVLCGTILFNMVAAFESVTSPTLPLAITLQKSVTLAGVALSQKNSLGGRGADGARLSIETAGGMVANTYSLLVAESGSGKDIGNLLAAIARDRGCLLGDCGTAEGLMDALLEKPNGLVQISEFSAWLNPDTYQGRATPFLTSAFSGGTFSVQLSKRTANSSKRESEYCFPNISASIQPEPFKALVRKADVSTGFLGRFIVFVAPPLRDFPRPTTTGLSNQRKTLNACYDVLSNKQGRVSVPANYLGDLAQEFLAHAMSPNLNASWRRLINEYGPRLALMLSITKEQAKTSKAEITSDGWAKAAVLIRWLFKNAESMLSDVEDATPRQKEQEKLIKRLFMAIHARKDGMSHRELSQNFGKYSKATERNGALSELFSRELIKKDPVGKYHSIRCPPEWEVS